MAHPILSVLNDEEAQWHGNLGRREAYAVSRERYTHDFDQFAKHARAEQFLRYTSRALTERRMANSDYLDRGGRNIKVHLQSPKERVRSTYIRLAKRCARHCHRSRP